MSHHRIVTIALLSAAALAAGCKRAGTYSVAVNTPSPAQVQTSADKTIETEIVSAAPFAGVVTATGKILAAEDRTAVIGPVNEGRPLSGI